MGDALVKLQVALAELALPNSSGYRLIREGKLGPIVKRGRRSFILASDIQRYKDALPRMQTNRNSDNQEIIDLPKL